MAMSWGGLAKMEAIYLEACEKNRRRTRVRSALLPHKFVCIVSRRWNDYVFCLNLPASNAIWAIECEGGENYFLGVQALLGPESLGLQLARQGTPVWTAAIAVSAATAPTDPMTWFLSTTTKANTEDVGPPTGAVLLFDTRKTWCVTMSSRIVYPIDCDTQPCFYLAGVWGTRINLREVTRKTPMNRQCEPQGHPIVQVVGVLLLPLS